MSGSASSNVRTRKNVLTLGQSRGRPRLVCQGRRTAAATADDRPDRLALPGRRARLSRPKQGPVRSPGRNAAIERRPTDSSGTSASIRPGSSCLGTATTLPASRRSSLRPSSSWAARRLGVALLELQRRRQSERAQACRRRSSTRPTATAAECAVGRGPQHDQRRRTQLPATHVALDCLTQSPFDGAVDGGNPGFGGPETRSTISAAPAAGWRTCRTT